MSAAVRVRRGGMGGASGAGGAGRPTLVLLHGLGAVGEVWAGVEADLEEHWPGGWITPDLPGHGGSAPAARYTFAALAAAVAAALPPSDQVAVLGHSLGGVVALELASGRYGVRPLAVAGLGIKVRWSEDELARAAALAGRPNPVYSTRREAAERYLKVAGLAGLAAPEQVPDAALARTGEGWRTAFDPAAFGVGAPDLPALLGAATCPVVLAAGERDPMCPGSELARLVADPLILPGLGHNAHVERPAAVRPVLDRLSAAGP